MDGNFFWPIDWDKKWDENETFGAKSMGPRRRCLALIRSRYKYLALIHTPLADWNTRATFAAKFYCYVVQDASALAAVDSAWGLGSCAIASVAGALSRKCSRSILRRASS